MARRPSGSRYIKKTALSVILAAAVLCTAAAGIYHCCFSPFLVIENTKTDEMIYKTPSYDGLVFSISFLHSINRSDVEEIYEVRNGRDIYLTACRYHSFGAGVAYETEPGQTLIYESPDTMLLSGIGTRIEDLTYFLGTVYDHHLHIGGADINLSDIGGKGISARIYIRRMWTGGKPH